MCLQCHSGLSDEEILKQFTEAIERDNNFERWNTTSISHLELAAIGLNGQEPRTLAISLLEKYIVWRRTQPDDYIPK